MTDTAPTYEAVLPDDASDEQKETAKLAARMVNWLYRETFGDQDIFGRLTLEQVEAAVKAKLDDMVAREEKPK